MRVSGHDWSYAFIVLFAYGVGFIVLASVVRGVIIARAIQSGDDDGDGLHIQRPRFASWTRRFIALLIDIAIVAVIAAGPTLLVHPVLGAVVFCFTASVYLPMGYGVGRTLGTFLTRIRIVNNDGGEPGLTRGALRYLMLVEMLPSGYGGRTAAIRGPGGTTYWPATMQGVHDKLADTYVIRI